MEVAQAVAADLVVRFRGTVVTVEASEREHSVRKSLEICVSDVGNRP